MNWSIRSNVRLSTKQYDDEFIVYCIPSGDTHHFDPLNMAILDALVHSQKNAQEIIKFVADRHNYYVDDELQECIVQMLNELQKKKLIIQPLEARS